MKRKIKRFKVSPDESLCLAVSVVDKPAVESDFIYMSEQRIEKFVGVDGERKMIYGCALRPDFPIYRRNDDEEYYLEFSKEAVDKISKNYFKMGFQSNWTAAHKEEVEGLTITESWIKEDMYKDKSVAIGLDADLPVGSWFIGCHCENDDIWNAVKEGSYNGFSIEAVVGLEEFEAQANNNKTNEVNMELNESFWSRLKSMLTEVFTSAKIEEPEEKMEDEITIGDECAVEMEEQAPETPTDAVPEPQEAVEEVKVEDAPVVEKEAVTEEIKPQEPEVNPLEEIIKNLQGEIKALKESNDKLIGKVKDLGKQPSSKPLSTNAKADPKDTYQQWRNAMREMIG